MSKKLSVIVFCFVIGVFFFTNSYSQDDPATTGKNEVKLTDTEGDKKTETAAAGPEAKVFILSGNIYANSKVQFKLQSKDNVLVDKILYKVDNGDFQTYQNPFAIDTEGNHLVSYYGVDKIGNQEDSKLFRVIIDTSAPELDVASNSPLLKVNGKYYVSKSFTFSINSYDTLSGINKVDYSLNGEAKEYTSPFSIASEGEIELKVSAIDNVNNKTDQFSFSTVDDKGKKETMRDASVKLAIDNKAPEVMITPSQELPKTSDNKNLASTMVKYSVSATDPDSGVASIQVRLDGVGDFVAYINEIKFKTNGEHQIEAKAIDRVGNVSEVKSFSVVVDTLPPDSKLQTIPE